MCIIIVRLTISLPTVKFINLYLNNDFRREIIIVDIMIAVQTVVEVIRLVALTTTAAVT